MSDTMNKNDRMTFEEAAIKLKAIAKRRYHSLRYGTTTSYYGDLVHPGIEPECSMYIDGYTWYSGKTWYEAFHKLDQAMNPPLVGTEEKPTEVEYTAKEA